MFSTLALAGIAAEIGGPGLGLGLLLFIIVPLSWLGVFILFGVLARRRFHRGGFGHGHPGHPGQFGPWAGASRAAEATLAERFAQGDIDEKEFRARLEVLRANNPFVTSAPTK